MWRLSMLSLVVLYLGAVIARAERFEEMAPSIDEIEVKKGDPFIEVFVSGVVESECYDIHEFHVERVEEEHMTRIIPRFRRSNPDKPCKRGAVKFSEKATDLDPAQTSSYRIALLGHRGWHLRELPIPPQLAPTAGPQPSEAEKAK